MKRYIHLLLTFCMGLLPALISCTSDIEEAVDAPVRGVRAYAEVTLGDRVQEETRAFSNQYDYWSISSFSQGDKVGLYALKGRQNPEVVEDFSLSVENGQMFFEGRTGNYYRFGSSEIVLDPATVSKNYSIMYYPYYENMPAPEITDPVKGMELREEDSRDRILKCKDFMYTNANYIYVDEGVMKPSFKHYFFSLIIQRGEGFMKAPDQRIWIVMKKPFTDIRIARQQYTNSVGAHIYTLQYNPEEPDDVMIDILPGESKFSVNKYAVWEAWDGGPYKGVASKYAILPPEEISFIFMQDDYGNWQNVSDFYISGSGSKSGSSGYRYVLTIELEGVNVVVRPVSVLKWDEEVEISDNRKVGINNFDEYYSWATIYNTYVGGGRRESDSAYEELRKYGDGVKNTATGNTAWTFYINSDITFPNSSEFPRINLLEDVLEGSSTYTNYTITNIRQTLIEEMGTSGSLRALDFRDLYTIQASEDTRFFYGGLINNLNGGTVENCNIFNGVVVGNETVGILAGSTTSGSVKNCEFSGDIIGVKTSDEFNGLFGIVNGYPAVSNIKTSGLQFIER